MKFTDKKVAVIITVTYLLVIGVVFSLLITLHSPWWVLLMLLLLSVKVRYNSTCTCPKCGHVFEDKTLETENIRCS